MNKYICHSGGAKGTDALFAEKSLELGIKVINHSFVGHLENNGGETIIHTEEELKEADSHLLEASKILKRKFPSPNAYITNLLRRNYFIIRDVPVVYAISELETENTVKGGTGWGCAMAMNLGKSVWLYDQYFSRWMYSSNTGIGFIRPLSPPTLENIFAGIGARSLKNNGMWAITNLLKQK